MFSFTDKLYRLALRITGNTAEAEDVVQEVAIKNWEMRDKLSEVRNQEAWCMQMTKNLSIDKTRSKHRQVGTLPEYVDFVADSPTPSHISESADTLSQINRFMALLPEKQRLVIHCRDIEGLSYEDISVTLDLPLPQVKVYLHRARQTLREQIIKIDQYGLPNN